ncbi:MBL fold metallo-hydrolase [Plantibacter sp. CFBP 13570]|uniref:MBL fold metallo-hydrolase n=1 Tax=Plantibacter sp. CFBP 13570 TaxID=2775272 RepID=UPI00237AE50F|nr:MBL fold metallo-hydrolase [Plantibacter sp. CFBP 13570]
MTALSSNLHFVQGPLSNWIVMTDGTSASLIDSGYPADAQLVERSVRAAAGGNFTVVEHLVTHAHTDHIGSAELLRQSQGTVVRCAAAEVEHLSRTERHQITFRSVLPRLWKPRIAAWAIAAVRAGGLADVGVQSAETFSDGEELQLPGRPIAMALAGHTAGHSAFYFPAEATLVLGDALVSAHPTSAHRGAQFLHKIFRGDNAETTTALERLLPLHVRTILPGHGPLLRITLAEAVKHAQRVHERAHRRLK